MHWTHVSKNRHSISWDASLYGHFREVLLHASARYAMGCARYVCMPDHIHLIWVGASSGSDQLKATRFLRRHLDVSWQKQAHDHVLRESERSRGAFVDTCQYLRENPVRAGLVARVEEWPYAGNMVPGFPDLDPWDSDQFWKCFLAYRTSQAD
ncbi:hypothetical protein [Coraliomargarita sinensis]|uniref:hypothetical protein n=1 Tax=Coraliomargarita sinensis TaxID=2174842 RepID=UPI001E51530D|nr:hypothetical protein [Coraliomargarita sinensis]